MHVTSFILALTPQTLSASRLEFISGLAVSDPFIDLVSLELPKPANLVRRHFSFGYPPVNRVFADTEVICDLLNGEPSIGHGAALPGPAYLPWRKLYTLLRLSKPE